MDYISNLIKRPLSLVVAEASTATDKTQTSTSLPSNLTNGQEDNKQQKQDQEQNNSNELNKNTSPKETHSLVLTKEQDVQQNNITDKKSTEVNQLPVTEQQQHSFTKGECSQELTRSLVGPSEFNQPHHRLLSLSSSFNGNFTDFIGVSNELLDLDEFLPPPPPLLSNSILLSPVEDNNNLQSTTPSPPPPPLSPSMMASQTIDELLSEISDNLTLAGINDEVLSIASPPKMSEHSPMSTSKTSLNNSKTLAPSSQAHLPKTPTNTVTAAGTAGTPSPSAVFEANSTLHKFHVDPDLATGLFDDQHFANELENSSGVNKSSNKFVGLTEFDEDKIPELPGDLNPNIEEQFNVTFEECFIPTLTANAKVSEGVVAEKTHLLLPNEVDNTSMSSANETFADCQDDNMDERDPLAGHITLNATTDVEGYESAVQEDFKEADVTIDAAPTQDNVPDQTQVIEETPSTANVDDPLGYEDEPMDVDMSITMDIIQDSSDKIQNVEKVLQHAENILQHLGEKAQQEENKDEIEMGEKVKEDFKVIGSIIKPTETSKMTFVISSPRTLTEVDPLQHLEMEQSKHDVSLNKSIELPMNKGKTMSTECVITALKNEELSELKQTKKTAADPKKYENPAPDNMNASVSGDASSQNIKQAVTPIEETNEPNATDKNISLGDMNASASGDLSTHNINQAASPIQETNEINEKNNFLSLDKMNASALNDISSEVALQAATPTEETNENIEKSMNFSLNKLNASASGDLSSQNTNQTAENNVSVNSMNSSDSKIAAAPIDNSNIYSTISNDTSCQSSAPAASPMDKKSLSLNNMNTSASSDAYFKSMEAKLESNVNVTTSLSSSTNSLKSSGSNSPSFPTKSTGQTSSFPKAPVSDSNNKPRFLEKSDYIVEMENKQHSQEKENNLNGNVVETQAIQIDSKSTKSHGDKKRLTYNLNAQDANVGQSDSKRLTFNVQSDDSQSDMEVAEITETMPSSEDRSKSRRTFNVPLDDQPIPMDTSFTPMDVDHNVSQNSTLPMTDAHDPNAQTKRSDELSELTNQQQRSQSPALPGLSSEILPPPASNQSQTETDSKSIANESYSSPLPTLNNRSNSPPLPAMQNRTHSPPLPAMQAKSQSPLPSSLDFIKTEKSSPPLEPESSSPPISLPTSIAQKRPSIHGYSWEVLSAKEQSNIKIKDEKDEYFEKSTPSPMEDVGFTTVSATSTTPKNSSVCSAFDQISSEMSNTSEQEFGDDEFQGNSNLILNPSDFDYLLTKGNNNTPVDRSSLLLKFDPLLGVPVPVNQGQQTQQQHHYQQQQLHHLQIPTNLNNNPCLSPTIEEDEHNESTNRSFVVDYTSSTTSLGGGRDTSAATAAAAGSAISSSAKLLKERSQEVKQQFQQHHNQQIKRQLPQPGFRKNATMSVDVIKDMSLDNNDCNKTFENSNSTQPDDKQINYKMDELEKKVKNEVLKTEDIEKKLKEAEQREEALIKRITEKDKTVAKMNGVIEAYEKAIAELIAEKEQLIQNYEKQLAEVKADRDSNYHHLTSLETTFSDLHVKYEKSKEMTCQLKANEEGLIAENRKNAENLRLQEQRYDKMKNHAMQQLEIANKKLECLTREHTMEITKLKALLKKEEIARSSMSEQLAQKSKENAELVKICDELISGQGS
uniref:Transforming acidic coiled-coil-containing protein C-terminal domain-containing protein n=1 Tax=Stomoxys calcitrans TaxID=35570 RepID=A0A1I8PNF6_STOCA|nr:unnamed protein product [Stomoxys calcitrans]